MDRMTCDAFVHFTRSQVKGKNVLMLLCLLLTMFLRGLVTPLSLWAAPGDITTIAGGGVGDTGSASSASLYLPRGIYITAAGVIYIADTLNHRVRKIDTNGIITTVAGTGRPGFSGDGGPATSASLKYPQGITVDHAGNIFIADAHNDRVRKVNANGLISTIIGGGVEKAADYCSLSATDVGDIFPRDIFLDSFDRIHIIDGRFALWRLETDGALINLSDPTCGFGFIEPGLSNGFFDVSGAFIYASGNNIFRTIDMQSSALLGAFSADSPGSFTALSGDAFGNIYVAVPQSNIVHKFDPMGTSTVFAGTGTAGYSGDGGNAIAAHLSNPTDVFGDAAGNVYISDRFNHRIRKVDPNGTITTVAGTGEAGYAGDGLAGTSERLNIPRGVFVDSAGNVYIADTYNHRVRKIDTAGIMTTIAGNGVAEFSGDGGAAFTASLSYPTGIFVHADGSIYIADSFNDRIRRVDSTGTITTIAGTDDTGYAGDGGQATLAVLNYPTGVIVDGMGNVFIADLGNNAIRKIDTSGIISTYANIVKPRSMALDSSGVLYVATNYDGINRVYPDGTLDVMPSCTDAVGVAVDSAGTVYIACQSDNIIAGATPGMLPGLVAGTGDGGFSGDGGAALTALLASPSSVFVDASGAIYIADSGNNRVRRIEPGSKIVPWIKILSPWPGLISSDKTPLLSYTVSYGTVVVKVDGVLVNKVSGNQLDPLADGQHTVRVEATYSNVTGFAERTFTVDTVAPIISIVSPQGVLSNNTPSLVYSVNEPVSYSYVVLDGTLKWIVSGESLGTLSEGQHSIVISAQDYAWNTATAVVNFSVDTIPPVLSVSPAASPTKVNAQTITGTRESGAIVTVALNTAATAGVLSYPTSTTWSSAISGLVEGPNDITVTATDAAGNSAWAAASIIYDSVAPTVVLSSPSAGRTNNNSPVLTYAASDGTVVMKVDGIIVSKVSGNTLDSLADGSHTVRVESTDAAGNMGFAEVTFVVDTLPPTVTVNPVATPTKVNTQTIGGGRENEAIITVSVDTSASVVSVVYPTDTTWSSTVTGLAEGINIFTITAKDAVQNSATVTASLSYDSIAPIVSISSPGPGVTKDNTPHLAYAITGGTLSMVGVDGVTVFKISGQDLDAFADGLHTVRVEATDAAGNTGFAQVSFIIDTAPPVVAVNAVSTPTNVSSQTLTGIREENAAVTVAVNTSASVGAISYPSASTWSCTVSDLAAGGNTVTITATDAAGNPATAIASITYDAVAPTVALASPGSAPTNDNTPLLTYSVSDGSIVVKVDGVVVSKVSGDSLNTLSDGSHTVRVESTDAAGNTGFAQVTFIVDTVPPALSINPVTTPTKYSSQTITGTRESGISVSVTVSTSATIGSVSYPSSMTWRCTISNLVRGSNVITSRAVDAAGNNRTATATITKK